MTKRSLLAIAIASLTSQAALAAPFLPMDARGLAMGNTGVASAARAHAPAYNPSLLSQGSEDDDFALLFPQLGANVSDEEELVDEAQLISDEIFPAFEDAIEGSGISDGLDNNLDTLTTRISQLETAINSGNAAQIKTANDNLKAALTLVDGDLDLTQSSITDLTESLGNISGSPLSARLGVGGALAIPSKKFAAAVSVSGSANISGRVNFADSDLDLLNSYVPAAQGYIDAAENVTSEIDSATADNNVLPSEVAALKLAVEDLQDYSYTSGDGTVIFDNGELSDAASNANLSSTAEIVAVAIADVGVSFSREFDIAGEAVAIGITPKLQMITTYHYADEVDGFEDVEEDDLEDSKEDYSNVNLDIGASWRFGGEKKWIVGVVGKNLLGGEFDYADVTVTPKDSNGNPNGLPYTIDGGSVSLEPQFRAGLAYDGDWVNAAIDLDLMENDPIAFESATQFLAFGAEFDVFGTVQLRAGYRTNLSNSGSDIVSVGLGLSPFGVHFDIAAMANIDNPESEAGVALETGFYF
ncbi:conjugal transfer protein TraF [Thalassolituus marinus]|uniref:Conjugal transfer protein TraF n=1 Tax=Thalassolituus marinus TaxID=671053 RepID=A0ABS7ZR73_9GAMM|nr:conjugal transfer protein TraF [Thalassolituus marinus]MCA6064222.1 conjugal transfer protein TraF [Thalassolituus marinus]